MQHERHFGSFFGPAHFVEILMHRAGHQPDQRALGYLVDGEQDEIWVTYAELDRQARAIAARLGEMGLQGERALLLYPSGLEFIAALFGCFYAGVLAVPLSAPLRRRSLHRIRAVADDADAAVALTVSQVYERIAGELHEEPHLERLTWLHTDTLDLSQADRYHQPVIDASTLALLQYTSGSTDTPRGVVLSHANLIHNSAVVMHCFEHTRSSSGFHWLPSFHDFGLIGGILQPIYCGGPNIIMNPMAFLQKPLRWLTAMTRYRATTSGGPNFAYDLCVRKIAPEQRVGLDLSHWQVACNGAEPVQADTIDRFCEAFEPYGFRREVFYPAYGLAEATLIVSGGYKNQSPIVRHFDLPSLETHQVRMAEPGTRGAQRMVACGAPVPDTRIVIVDPQTRHALPGDAVGEIWISGPGVAAGGYWRKGEESRERFKARLAGNDEGPFLRTGDLGFLYEGQLYVTGRLHDLVIVRGRNHYPQDIERTAEAAHAWLRPDSHAAFSIDVDGVTRIALVSELDRRRDDVAEVFQAIRREVLDEHGIALDAIALITPGSLPRTTSGKVQRYLCRRAFIEGTLSEVAHWKSWDGAAVTLPAAAPIPARGGAGAQITSAPAQLEAKAHASPRERSLVHPPRERVERVVVEQVRRLAPDISGSLSLKTSVLDLGLDSLQRMDLLAGIEQELGGRFPQEIIAHLLTLNDIVEAAGRGLASIARDPDDIDDDHADCDVQQFPEYRQLKERMAQLAGVCGENPFFRQFDHVASNFAVLDGRHLHNYAICDYLGLMHHPALREAAKQAIDTVGHSLSASRLVCDLKSTRELEAELAAFVGSEAALVFPNGHAANVTVMGHLFGPRDLILYDALAHNSLIQGAVLSGATRRAFPHNDWQYVDELLSRHRHAYRRVLIAMDGLYSMDGDHPDLPRFVELRRKHRVMLLVDDAHGIGTVGRTGRGVAEVCGIARSDVDLWMGSLCKALGAGGGGFYAGSAAMIEYLQYTAPGFVFSLGLAPPMVAEARAGLRIAVTEPQRLERLRQRTRLFVERARARGLNISGTGEAPIIPLFTGDAAKTLRLAQELLEHGVNAQPILPPAVPPDAARLRFFITCEHTEAQIIQTIDVVAELLAAFNAPPAPAVAACTPIA